MKKFVIGVCLIFIAVEWSFAETGTYSEIEVSDGASIIGAVLFTGDTIPERERLVVDKDIETCTHEPKLSERFIISEDQTTKEKRIKNVVVYLDKVEKGKPFEKPTAPFHIDQKGCVFTPHVLVVPKVSTVELRNSDNVMHNIHSYSLKNASFNESIPGNGKPVLKTFEFPEIVKLTCDVHKWMSAWLVVRDNPYYAVTDEAGVFKIESIPQGTYKLVAWHESLGKQTKDITVKDSERSEVKIEFVPKK